MAGAELGFVGVEKDLERRPCRQSSLSPLRGLFQTVHPQEIMTKKIQATITKGGDKSRKGTSLAVSLDPSSQH